MTMTPLPPSAAPAGRVGVPPTAPTGAPVPAETAAGFVALLLAALPQAETGQAPTGQAPVVQTDATADGEALPAVPGDGTGDGTGEDAGSANGTDAAEAAAGLQGKALLLDHGLLSALGLSSGILHGPVVTRADAGGVPESGATSATQAEDGATGQVTPSGLTGATGGVTGTPVATVPGQLPAGALDGETPTATTTAATTTAPVTAAGQETSTGPGPDATAATEAARATDGTQPRATSETAALATDTPAAAPAAATGAVASGEPAGSQGSQSIAGLTPVSAAGQVRADAPQAPQAPAPVAAQVFPEVTRLVTRGDGTHRLTLTLSPESLGDVRVVLSVRGGEVTVTFTAGSEAQQALMESAPELRRLLELTGATESRILLRDSAQATQTSQHTAGQQTAGQSSTDQAGPEQQAGSGADQDQAEDGRDQHDHHAGTREGQHATDGIHRGTGASRLPHDPVTSPRPAGVDVTV